VKVIEVLVLTRCNLGMPPLPQGLPPGFAPPPGMSGFPSGKYPPNLAALLEFAN
jgi:hypothetical protein